MHILQPYQHAPARTTYIVKGMPHQMHRFDRYRGIVRDVGAGAVGVALSSRPAGLFKGDAIILQNIRRRRTVHAKAGAVRLGENVTAGKGFVGGAQVGTGGGVRCDGQTRNIVAAVVGSGGATRHLFGIENSVTGSRATEGQDPRYGRELVGILKGFEINYCWLRIGTKWATTDDSKQRGQ